ncbi:HAD family hydrolase [Muricauda sp. NFXS6]|uniref:HAD family hydrolase n=1 Tax=Allomuricauda sp. NFXS6 TaxID=2819094 RepID=UPI0032E03742
MDIKVNKNTALVFDLDDTLYNEIDFLKSAYREISATLDPLKKDMLFVKMFSLYRSGENAFEYLVKNYGADSIQILNQYRNHVPLIQPFPGVQELFLQIKEKNGKIGVVTDGRESTQINKLKALGLFGQIDHLVISETVGQEKPSLKNFKVVENYLRVKDYYYFGDNFKKDFIAPLKLGWQTVGLMDNGMNVHCHNHVFMEDGPQKLINSLKEINII